MNTENLIAQKDSTLLASVSDESVLLIKALEKQTAAINRFAVSVVELTDTLRVLLQEDEDGNDHPSSYLNGDPIEG